MTAAPALLTPAELGPWVETVLRLYNDRGFAVSHRSLALGAGQRWAPASLVPVYARFLAGLVVRRQRHQETVRLAAESAESHTAAAQRLREQYAWPEQRPADAAPG
jgi:hypothetical protein